MVCAWRGPPAGAEPAAAPDAGSGTKLLAALVAVAVEAAASPEGVGAAAAVIGAAGPVSAINAAKAPLKPSVAAPR